MTDTDLLAARPEQNVGHRHELKPDAAEWTPVRTRTSSGGGAQKSGNQPAEPQPTPSATDAKEALTRKPHSQTEQQAPVPRPRTKRAFSFAHPPLPRLDLDALAASTTSLGYLPAPRETDGEHPLETAWSLWFEQRPRHHSHHGHSSRSLQQQEQQEPAQQPAQDESLQQAEQTERKPDEPMPERTMQAAKQTPPPPPPPRPHPEPGDDQAFERSLTNTGTFDTLEGAIRHFCYIRTPDELPRGSALLLFRAGKKPMWEVRPCDQHCPAAVTGDEAGCSWLRRLTPHRPLRQSFPDGGCMILRMARRRPILPALWLTLAKAAVGEQFELASVVGVSVTVRAQEDDLSVWATDTSFATRERISLVMRRLLHLQPGTPLHWMDNASAIRDHSMFFHAKEWRGVDRAGRWASS